MDKRAEDVPKRRDSESLAERQCVIRPANLDLPHSSPRFDLASILTRANSAWHPNNPPRPGGGGSNEEEGREGADVLSEGAVVDPAGIMTDGEGV